MRGYWQEQVDSNATASLKSSPQYRQWLRKAASLDLSTCLADSATDPRTSSQQLNLVHPLSHWSFTVSTSWGGALVNLVCFSIPRLVFISWVSWACCILQEGMFQFGGNWSSATDIPRKMGEMAKKKKKQNPAYFPEESKKRWVNEITDASESKSCRVTGNAGCQISEHGGC